MSDRSDLPSSAPQWQPAATYRPGLSRRVVQRGTYSGSPWAPPESSPDHSSDSLPPPPEEQLYPRQWAYDASEAEQVQPVQAEQVQPEVQSWAAMAPTSYGYTRTQPSNSLHSEPQNPSPQSSKARNQQHGNQQSGKKEKRGPGWLALITATVLAAVLGAGAGLVLHPDIRDGLLSDTSAPAGSSGGSDLPGDSEQVVPPVTEGIAAPDWQQVAATVRPATVSIMVEGSDSAGTGSGVVYDDQGHVVTNHHVVQPALDGGTITVTTHDGRVYEASVVGTDSTTDLAVLHLEAQQSLPAARFATSEVLEVGQPVMAVGSPLGLADTVTTGVISALDRPVTVEASGGVDPTETGAAQVDLVVTNAIQIDASINPGNSGGPLFDATGGVIGINSSIASNSSSSETAGSIGLGFAIPVDLVASVVSQIIESGSVQHARLGVEIRSGVVARGNASQLGAEVATVMTGGAAEEAGLQPGDVIIAIDGKPVTSGPALTGFVRRYTAGDQVTLEVVRDGEDMQVTATLQAR